MKKNIFRLTLVILSVCFFAGFAYANTTSYICSRLTIGDTYTYVNDEDEFIDVAPYIKDGRTLIPLRFMEKALNAEVSWDAENRMVTVKTYDREVRVFIGRESAQLIQNSLPSEVKLDVPPEIKSGRTFVPLRFISESLGAAVQYEADTKSIAIIYPYKDKWQTYAGNGLTLSYPSEWTVITQDESGIIFNTPNDTSVELKSQTKAMETLVQEKMEPFDDIYWELYTKESLGFVEGTRIYGANDLEGWLYEIYVMKIDNEVYTWEKSGWSIEDEKMFRYIITSMFNYSS